MIDFLEWAGSLSGLAGAFLLATHSRISRYGWLAFLVANFAMIGFALGIHRYGLFVQQLGFMGTSFLGIYRAGFALPFRLFRGVIMGIVPGSRCQIISVHHRCFNYELGRVVVVVKVLKDSVMAHDDKPVTYRSNRNGRRVVRNDPRCIQTFYGLEQLRLLPYGSLTSY